MELTPMPQPTCCRIMARGLRVTLLLNSSSEIWVPPTISFHSIFLKHVPQKPTVLRTTKQKVIQSGLVKKMLLFCPKDLLSLKLLKPTPGDKPKKILCAPSNWFLPSNGPVFTSTRDNAWSTVPAWQLLPRQRELWESVCAQNTLSSTNRSRLQCLEQVT